MKAEMMEINQVNLKNEEGRKYEMYKDMFLTFITSTVPYFFLKYRSINNFKKYQIIELHHNK